MNYTIWALSGYIIWMVVLVVFIAGIRSLLTLSGKRAANSFNPQGSDVSEFSARLCRAHANCYESFPIVGGTLIMAIITNFTTVTDSLALVVLFSRLLQSITHMISTSVPAVMIRFSFFLVQIFICVYWIILLAQHFMQ